ncbi:invasin [Klebsiella pneumoniae]|uniref:Invasin n=1 Tax=Klebsiella pneumoniae TaxID=573 RepID=A0A378A6T0_KLEPN|nr:invasin [Klebsiella pneumoniae]
MASAQNNVGLKLNYRFGVPLKQQLAADEVADQQLAAREPLRIVRSGIICRWEYRQRKNLTVYLATPPGICSPGKTVQLKLQIHSLHASRRALAGRHPRPSA